MGQRLNQASLAAVPIFPLPRVVLFPGTRLPLHIFEPRYRELTRACLSQQDPLMVVVQLLPGFEADYHGRPPIYPVGGLGRIVRHRENPDGTFDLLLEAFSRVSLQELPADGLPYRRAAAEYLTDIVPAQGLDADEMTALLSFTHRITEMLQQAEPGFELGLDADEAPGSMTDHVADQLVLAPEGRQAVLECLDIGARVRMVVELLARLHAALNTHQGHPNTVH